MIQLFIAGDVVPKGIRPEEFKSGEERVFKEIKPYIVEADFSVVNLEAPIFKDQATPIKKSGPCLGVDFSTIEMLKDVGFNIITLANNHFFDQGQTGVDTTLIECVTQGIKTVGGGKTKEDARKPLMIEKDGKIIALINACEHEFSVADETHGGSNPLDLISMQEDITTARKEADYVVLVLHGGIEQYHFPTPRMKRWYRHFVDIGADAVVNHHQHCVNGYEVYNGKPIFYGLGNFYFPRLDGMPDYASWKYGYAVILTFGEAINYEMIPYTQDIEGIHLRDSLEFEREIEVLNHPITDNFLLQQKFDDYIISEERNIKLELLPSILRGRMGSALARRGVFGKIYKGKQVYALKNRLTCESHHEKMKRLFEILIR